MSLCPVRSTMSSNPVCASIWCQAVFEEMILKFLAAKEVSPDLRFDYSDQSQKLGSLVEAHA